MALDAQFAKIKGVLLATLTPDVRYRCLVFQVSDLAVLASLSDVLTASVFPGSPGKPVDISYLSFLDDVGAFSCEAVLDEIGRHAKTAPVVLIGPLHFLDYWSSSLQATFWAHLASFTEGPGIIVIDTLRTKGIDGRFVICDFVSELQIRILRSRLAATEVRFT